MTVQPQIAETSAEEDLRSHARVIDEAGGSTAVAAALYERPGYSQWPSVQDLANTVQGWKRSDSIPPEYWPDFDELGLATPGELALAIRRRRPPMPRAAAKRASP